MMREAVIKEWADWRAKAGPQSVHKLLEPLFNDASKATSAKDKRTRASAKARIEKALARLEAAPHPLTLAGHPDRMATWTQWETATALRVACTELGQIGGMQSQPLPRDSVLLSKVVDCALKSLPSARMGRPADKVNACTLQKAGSLERERIVEALNDGNAQRRSGENDGVERAASRLRECGHIEDTWLGRVAGVVRLPKGRKLQK